MSAAAPATLLGLHRAVRSRLAEVAAGFPLLETKAGTREPTVVEGWLPPKTSSHEDFPFLIVRPRRGTDTEQGASQESTANIEILIGTYSDEDNGWLDVLLIIDAIRLSLHAEPVLVMRGGDAPYENVQTAFEHVGPLEWDLPPEEQARPQWIGRVIATFRVPRPERVEARNPKKE